MLGIGQIHPEVVFLMKMHCAHHRDKRKFCAVCGLCGEVLLQTRRLYDWPAMSKVGRIQLGKKS